MNTLTRRAGISAEEQAILARTAILPWDSIWVAGGAITPRRSPAPGVYEVSQITLGTALPLWISADAASVDAPAPADEVFHIAVAMDANRGQEEHEKRWRPRRAELQSAPEDLDLEPFRWPRREYAILTEHVTLEEPGGPVVVAVDRGLLVVARTGERLLFWADQEVPLDMFVTTRASYIDERLAEMAAIRPVSPEA